MKKLTYDTFKRMRKDEKEDVFRQAHDCSIRNKRQLEQSKLCGCFSCCEIFPPSERLHIRRRTYSRMPLLPHRRRNWRRLRIPYYRGVLEENDA
ncbi:hypothetical protein [Prevotella sp.]|uniref:hypothetical protein n=1 Tax=Prevotella sp. TaxID=59823 RepID=UPI0027E2F2CE|nr:hypothetical protein [Prevotella sp.]